MRRFALLVFLLLFFNAVNAQEFSVHQVTTFVSPDSSYQSLVDFIADADSCLYVNVYTFRSPYIADALIEAEERGAEVIVVVDKAPVGGISEEEMAVLGRLSDAGVALYYSDIPELRFNHAKYLIADNVSILITTENFGDTGFPPLGSYGNRGWGIIVEDPGFASYLLELFFQDLKAGREVDVRASPGDFMTKKGRYKPRFMAEEYVGDFVATPLVAPMDAVDKILGLIASANSSVYVEQMYIYRYWGSKREGYGPNPFLEACIEAARRGCEVKILLDSTWYNVQAEDPVSNLYTLQYVNEIAEREGLNLEARLVDFKKAGFDKLHTKGVVIDDKVALISSVNWNQHSPTKNREVGVIVYGEPAKYFSEVFKYDWSGEDNYDSYYWILIPIAIAILVYFWRRR